MYAYLFIYLIRKVRDNIFNQLLAVTSYSWLNLPVMDVILGGKTDDG